jgi:DNA-directed RNA polymerase
MRYENYDSQTVKTIVAGNVRRHRINVENGTTSKRKTVNGICANLVHSFDGIGGIFGLTLLKCLDKGVNNVFGVHDAASVLATDCDLFNKAVREATVEIFSEDWLGKIEEMFLTLLPSGVHLPPAPQRGDLDITKVLESPYYWN